MKNLARPEGGSVDVERGGSGGRALFRKLDLLHLRLGGLQQPVAMTPQRLAARIELDALLQRDIAPLQPSDDLFKFLQRGLEGEIADGRFAAVMGQGVGFPARG